MTDLPTYAAASYFRLGDNRFYVPVSVLVPGSQLPFSKTTGRSKATVDVLGMVRDAQQRVVGRIRDTVRLAPDSVDALKTKLVQYQTGLEMTPGTYSLKVVVRENQDGTFGAYETTFTVPDVKAGTLHMSSVVLGTRLEVAARGDRNPLVSEGQALIPNIGHVVSSAQPLYFYYEVYEPGRAGAGQGAGVVRGRTGGSIRLMTSVSFFRGTVRAFETPAVEVTQANGANGKAIFRFSVPAASLPPGLYTCQINVIDDVAAAFLFPRMSLLVRK